MFLKVLPSKMFEAMATARPIVLGVRGESEGLLREAQAGIAIPPEDAQALMEAIVRLADDESLRTVMGKAGRAYVTEKFNRDVLAQRMLEVLQQAAGTRSLG